MFYGFHLPDISAGIGTFLDVGCRSVMGPVPQLLWMKISYCIIEIIIQFYIVVYIMIVKFFKYLIAASPYGKTTKCNKKGAVK
ncbi:hypothetical protein AB840_05495 [Megasphaera cerevisiae DSM 20462]|uniref:Uncharacterized protein n=1 Tax=Megasphaera cerevisiae DSM 20462 TaxID=1122219 RepID=A0A0J6WXC3_9FIRM|nr:hypothetical protein AB840_05495 [Megasphaera cerevisiae DSM 20462]